MLAPVLVTAPRTVEPRCVYSARFLIFLSVGEEKRCCEFVFCRRTCEKVSRLKAYGRDVAEAEAALAEVEQALQDLSDYRDLMYARISE